MAMDGVEIIAGLIGVVMGFLYGVSGFADQGKVDDLSKNPRVKNLLWLLGGAGVVLLADWKIMEAGNVDAGLRGKLMASYAGAAVSTAIVVVLGMSAFIYLSAERRAGHMPYLVGRSGELVMEYVTFGFRAYRTRLEKLESEAGDGGTSFEALGALGLSLGVLLSAAALERTHNDPVLREDFIDRALDGIESTVKLFGAGVPDLQLRTNFMVIRRFDQLGAIPQWFVFSQPQPESRFLVLRRYRDQMAEAFAIPVAAPSDQLLPGAPLAAAEKKACALHPKRIYFRKGVPNATQTEVKHFFKAAGYASVLSVPLISGGAVVGIVNIESNHVELVGKGPEITNRIGLALAPFCVILGELVRRAEE